MDSESKSITEYIDSNLAHQNILVQNYPDAGYEYFWLNFKDSVKNVGRDGSAEMQQLSTEIDTCTELFNLFKEQGRYDEIGQHIQQFLKRFFRAVLAESRYHSGIALTNFKRWLKYCKMRHDLPRDGITPFDPLDDPEMNYIYFLHGIASSHYDMVKKHVQSGESREALLSNIIDEQYDGILGKFLETYPDWTRDVISKQYGKLLPNGIRNGKKAMKLLNKDN